MGGAVFIENQKNPQHSMIEYLWDSYCGMIRRSWRDMVLPGIVLDKDAQHASLAWIRRMDEDPLCIETMANHEAELEPHVIELS